MPFAGMLGKVLGKLKPLRDVVVNNPGRTTQAAGGALALAGVGGMARKYVGGPDSPAATAANAPSETALSPSGNSGSSSSGMTPLYVTGNGMSFKIPREPDIIDKLQDYGSQAYEGIKGYGSQAYEWAKADPTRAALTVGVPAAALLAAYYATRGRDEEKNASAAFRLGEQLAAGIKLPPRS